MNTDFRHPSPPVLTVTYLVTFERIGRTRNVPAHEVQVVAPRSQQAQALAEKLHRFAGKRLGSRWFDVDVTLETDLSSGTVLLDAGRFGKGTITRKEDA